VTPAILILAALFGLVLVARVGAARRSQLLQRWPALVLAGAAIIAVARGAWLPAAGLAALTVLLWSLWPSLPGWRAPLTAQPRSEPGADEARRILGVGPEATPAEIRRAYRSKMASAHPDRGGAHEQAARLTAARDRLLKRKP
jgi:hypothetical protein